MLSLPATLTLREASQTLRELLAELQRAPAAAALQLDASALKKFDSSALGVLLECRRHAQASGRTLQLQGAPQALLELAQLYGVQSLLMAPPSAAAQADPVQS
jgi:phospholipid transport system transporter-binding protein